MSGAYRKRTNEGGTAAPLIETTFRCIDISRLLSSLLIDKVLAADITQLSTGGSKKNNNPKYSDLFNPEKFPKYEENPF